jgi:hypothetical protein
MLLVLGGVIVGSGLGSAFAVVGMLLLGLTTVWHIESRIGSPSTASETADLGLPAGGTQGDP